MNRSPIVFAQTVAFAAATGSITWQVLRNLLGHGMSLGPLAIALGITAGFAAGALLFAAVLAPLQAHLGARARLRGGHWSRSLVLLQIAIGAAWTLAWVLPGFRFFATGGPDIFYGFACFLMGGLSGALFYPPLGPSRTPV